MGDRAQIKFIFNDNKAVFFYTHWTGSELHHTLASALKRGESRWGDAGYLARIIFSEMIKNKVLDTTGYGIDLSKHGDIHTLITVNSKNKQVLFKGIEHSFKDFISSFYDKSNKEY